MSQVGRRRRRWKISFNIKKQNGNDRPTSTGTSLYDRNVNHGPHKSNFPSGSFSVPDYLFTEKKKKIAEGRTTEKQVVTFFNPYKKDNGGR